MRAVLGTVSCLGMPSPCCPGALAPLQHLETRSAGFGKQARGGWGGGGFWGTCRTVLGLSLLPASKQPWLYLAPSSLEEA